jgi:hypothetical protein
MQDHETVIETSHRPAEQKGHSVRWNANTLIVACAVLTVAATAALRSSSVAVLAAVGLPGVLLIWGYSMWQARKWHDGPSAKDESHRHSGLDPQSRGGGPDS